MDALLAARTARGWPTEFRWESANDRGGLFNFEGAGETTPVDAPPAITMESASGFDNVIATIIGALDEEYSSDEYREEHSNGSNSSSDHPTDGDFSTGLRFGAATPNIQYDDMPNFHIKTLIASSTSGTPTTTPSMLAGKTASTVRQSLLDMFAVANKVNKKSKSRRLTSRQTSRRTTNRTHISTDGEMLKMSTTSTKTGSFDINALACGDDSCALDPSAVASSDAGSGAGASSDAGDLSGYDSADVSDDLSSNSVEEVSDSEYVDEYDSGDE